MAAGETVTQRFLSPHLKLKKYTGKRLWGKGAALR
jgi:hypothetical protein